MADRLGRRVARPQRFSLASSLAWLTAGSLALVVLLPGCENKLAPEQCDKLRADAFQTLNKAHHCAADADCRQSAWPGCQKPINNKDHDVIAPLADQYKQGKCEEPKIDCVAAPEVYCKQGLCVHREKGRDENAPPPGDGEIKME